MLTEVLDNPVAEPTTGELEQRYRKSIETGVYDRELAESVFRSKGEWTRTRERWQAVQKAHRVLTVDIPALEEEAAKLQAKANEVPALLATIDGGTTIDSIFATAEKCGMRVPTPWTPADVQRAISFVRQNPQRLKARISGQAQTKLTQAMFARRESEAVMFANATEPPANPESQRLVNEITGLKARMAANDIVIGAEAQIPAARQRVDDIESGRISPSDPIIAASEGWSGPPPQRWVEEKRKQMLDTAKKTLQKLKADAANKQAAISENKDAAIELASLIANAASIESERLAWMLAVEHFDWSK